ncbi:MAG: hypothetical protein R3F61_15555 [Myxococcota bacterium]
MLPLLTLIVTSGHASSSTATLAEASSQADFVLVGTVVGRRTVTLDTPVGEIATTRFLLQIEPGGTHRGVVDGSYVEFVVPGGHLSTGGTMGFAGFPKIREDDRMVVLGREYLAADHTLELYSLGAGSLYKVDAAGHLLRTNGRPEDCESSGLRGCTSVVTLAEVLDTVDAVVPSSIRQIDGFPTRPALTDEHVDENTWTTRLVEKGVTP